MEHFKDIKKPSILIVDDQLTSTEHISNILEQINVELYVAHDGYWKQVEEYIQEHSKATFNHSLCNDYIRELYPDVADKIIKK